MDMGEVGEDCTKAYPEFADWGSGPERIMRGTKQRGMMSGLKKEDVKSERRVFSSCSVLPEISYFV